MGAPTTMTSRRDDKTSVVVGLGLLLSVGLHAGLLVWASLKTVKVREVNRPVELQIVQLEPPKPPEPPPPEPPKPVEQPKPKLRPPPPIKVAVVQPPPVEPPPPTEEVK